MNRDRLIGLLILFIESEDSMKSPVSQYLRTKNNSSNFKMRTKKDKRGQKRKLKMRKLDYQMRQTEENNLRNVSVRVKIYNLDHQK